MENLRSEDEAGKSWCPETRSLLARAGAAINRTEASMPQGWDRCVASGCMFWRWAPVEEEREDERGRYSVRVGYCGEAGRPAEVVL